MSDTNGLYVGRQRGTVADRASDEANPPPVSVRMTDDLIETLLHWVYADQMAHMDGLGFGVFDGYGGGSLDFASGGWAGDGPRPAQLYAAAPKVHRYAVWVHGQVTERLAGEGDILRQVIVYAERRRRPDWPVPRMEAIPTYEGRPIGKDNPPEMVFGPEKRIRCKNAEGRRITIRDPLMCKVRRVGPDLSTLVGRRALYRRWVVAIGLVAADLSAKGVCLADWCEPVPPMAWWER